MDLWASWKKGFDAWEDATARHVERWLRSPLLLEPSGLVLKALTAGKALSDELSAVWWSALGLPTRRDQERTLHRLNELESRLLDLEEQLRAGAGTRAAAKAGAKPKAKG